MSLLQQKQVLSHPVPTDPLDRFLDARVPFRTLLAHGLLSLDWLAAQPDHPIHLVTRAPDGELCVETVDKIGFLERTHEMGWTPWAAAEEDNEVYLGFNNALAWFDDESQQQWYSEDDCCDEDLWIPLCLPEKISAAQEAHRIKRDRELAEAKAERDRKDEESMNSLVEMHIASAAKRGVSVSLEEARESMGRLIQNINEGMASRAAMRANAAAVSGEES